MALRVHGTAFRLITSEPTEVGFDGGPAAPAPAPVAQHASTDPAAYDRIGTIPDLLDGLLAYELREIPTASALGDDAVAFDPGQLCGLAEGAHMAGGVGWQRSSGEAAAVNVLTSGGRAQETYLAVVNGIERCRPPDTDGVTYASHWSLLSGTAHSKLPDAREYALSYLDREKRETVIQLAIAPFGNDMVILVFAFVMPTERVSTEGLFTYQQAASNALIAPWFEFPIVNYGCSRHQPIWVLKQRSYGFDLEQGDRVHMTTSAINWSASIKVPGVAKPVALYTSAGKADARVSPTFTADRAGRYSLVMRVVTPNVDNTWMSETTDVCLTQKS